MLRRKAIKAKLKDQRKVDDDLRYQLRPGSDDIKIMVKYCIDDIMVRNPFKEVSMSEFDPFMELPPIQTEALKIHGDNVIQARFRERHEEAERRRRSEVERLEANGEGENEPLIQPPGTKWELEKSRKRGYRSPLSNNSKMRVTEAHIGAILGQFRNRESEPKMSEDDEEVEDSQGDAAAAEPSH